MATAIGIKLINRIRCLLEIKHFDYSIVCTNCFDDKAWISVLSVLLDVDCLPIDRMCCEKRRFKCLANGELPANPSSSIPFPTFQASAHPSMELAKKRVNTAATP